MILVPNFLLVRSADHVLLGVSWSDLTIAERRPDGIPILKAETDDARLLLTFPPQHVAEETSRREQDAPQMLPSGSGAPVPVWRAALSGPSRLAFHLPRGTTLVPTVDGILHALSRGRPIPPASPPGVTDTALELPWRMVFSVEDRLGGQDVTSVHPVLPVTIAGVTGLWRARLAADRSQPGSSVQDACLGLRAIDMGTAKTADPVFSIPLSREQRTRLAAEDRLPAQATRLELSALGGTLSAIGLWDDFQWEHEAVLGRDVRVRTVTAGVLYPLGHRATYTELSERIFDQSAGNAAVLRSKFVLTVTEPVRRPPPEGPTARAFPFGDVEITTLGYPDLERAHWHDFQHPVTGQLHRAVYFQPTTPMPGGEPISFPVRCAAADGDVRFQLPLVFVADVSQPGFSSLTDPALAEHLSSKVYKQHTVPLPGVPLDLVRAATRSDGDVHEVHSITIEGSLHSTGYRPELSALKVRLPALRTLLGSDALQEVRFRAEYLSRGVTQDVLLDMYRLLDISFVGRSERSGGLVAPHFETNALSRTKGPIDLRALPAPGSEFIDPGRLFPGDATLLGFALKDLVTDLKAPPTITSVPQPGRPPVVTMEWMGVKLKESGIFQPTGQSTLDLALTASATGSNTHCSVRDFALVLPNPSKPLLKLQFASLTFTHHSGGPPRIQVGGVEVKFLGELQLLQELGDAVDLNDLTPDIDVTPAGLVAHYSLPLPSVTAGAFVMRDLAVNTEIAIPFDGQPVSVAFSFASRQDPFRLAVLMFGGGGYLELELDHTGLRCLEASLEFGAMLVVDFVVARGEVHALGGVRFELADGEVALTGYLRIGGCIEVLGLVSVSVELCITLAYQSATKALVGRATLVIEIDLTLWSDSVELDSGTWVLAGGRSSDQEGFALHDSGTRVLGDGKSGSREIFAARDADEGLKRWRKYQAAFVPITSGDQQ
ncbi:hypothetical protein [Streptomyces sp. MUM 178J]|uniref:hypothetical protein n=1 Tax=Streptomyces sp. MUM 178J TaxID=2791991 RepID=UPI001F037A12|nr:hypothetical protein [Streptomyces sp. MUM 178J]WRQ81952.1 hypothetical protein I3F59_022730 [Streptomyces sp. MUM 178J]